MPVSHDASSESATASTGSASTASFSWSHAGAASGVKGVLVFTFVNANANDALSVTYGGSALTAVTGGRAVDTATEPGDCKAWFLGSAVPQGTQTVIVNRNNNANVMYAVAITVVATSDTEVFDVCIAQENQAAVEEGINCGSNVIAVRYAGINSGLATHPAAGANSTELHFFPATAGTRSISTVRETTAGVGARYVGFSGASDDLAVVYLCVREVVTESAGLTFDCVVGMMVPDADDTILTTQIMRASNIGPLDRLGTTSAFTLTPATPTGLTKSALQRNMAPITAISVRSAGIVSINAPFKAIRVNHANNFIYYEQDLSSLTIRKCTMAGPLLVAVPDEGVGAELYDYWGFFGQVTGEFVVMQLGSGSAGPVGSYAMAIEVNPGGVTTHSAGIAVVPDTLYWCCLQCDFTGGTASLNIYTYPAMSLVGAVTIAQTTGEDIGHSRQGNGEIGQNAGHSSYFWCGLDWTVAAFPLIPSSNNAVFEDWFNPQRQDYPNQFRKADLVPSGLMPGRGNG